MQIYSLVLHEVDKLISKKYAKTINQSLLQRQRFCKISSSSGG